MQHYRLVFLMKSHRVLCEVHYELLCTGLFKMIVGVLTTCHTQYT